MTPMFIFYERLNNCDWWYRNGRQKKPASIPTSMGSCDGLVMWQCGRTVPRKKNVSTGMENVRVQKNALKKLASCILVTNTPKSHLNEEICSLGWHPHAWVGVQMGWHLGGSPDDHHFVLWEPSENSFRRFRCQGPLMHVNLLSGVTPRDHFYSSIREPLIGGIHVPEYTSTIKIDIK